MLSEATIARARLTAEELRQKGEVQPAEVIETILAEAQDDRGRSLDLLTSSQAGDLLGVTGQTIKNWVRDGRLTGYRIGGRIMVPRRSLETYVAQAGAALELEELSDEEAAALVAEGRRRT
jgi:excisionase family DNA binding protein